MARGSVFAPVKYDTFQCQGGLDLVTPTLQLPPGYARDSQNFEINVTGGYTRIAGYQRFDGRPQPNDAQYVTLSMSAVTGLSVGTSITDVTSGATGVVCYIANNDIAVTKATGTFNIGDTIQVGATVIGTVAPFSAPVDSLSQALYQKAAADIYRNDIGAVPGSGPVRGVVNYNGAVYAWRNNAGGTAMQIYKSSTSGWQLVSLGYTLGFTGATGTEPIAGSTVTGATSGATGTIERVVVRSGAGWSGQSGDFILSVTTGTFAAGENLNVGGVKVAVAAGAATAITLAPNGRVQTVTGSVDGGASKVYGCDNVNAGFEFDGSVYVPIKTGMTLDIPTNVAVHKNYLFLSFANSVQNSGVGTPYIWSVVFGANEFTTADNVTALLTLPGNTAGGSLAVFCKTNTYILYGASTADFQLVPYNQGIGCTAYTAQNMDDAYTLGDRGVSTLRATLNFGNFDTETLTFNIRPFIQARRTKATASALNREKSQYRVFYSDGYGLYVTIVNGQPKGSMPVYFPDPVFCWAPSEGVDGYELSYYGGNSGYVYQLDVGPNFDGGSISAYFTLVYNSENMARVLKRYRRASLEASGTTYADFSFGYTLAYGSSDIDQSTPQPYTVPFQQVFWDAFVWDQFTWDGKTLAPTETDCNGTGENIAVAISSNSAVSDPFTINSITLHYTPRRGIR